MKKTLIILALIAMVIVPVAAVELEDFQVGLEAGYPGLGLTGVYELKDDFDITASVNYNWGKALNIKVGALHDIVAFKVTDNVVFPVKVGAETIVNIAKGNFWVGALALGSVNYDFQIKDLDFTAFVRLGLGLKTEKNKYFAFDGVLGCVYHF